MTPTATVSTPVEELPGIQGDTFGPSEWRVVTQDDVDLYARVSGDDNPIHVDADFAATTPFGTRIAHGMLTLGLVVPLMREVFEVTGFGMGVNYGMNRVRFPAPVPVGARIRVHGEVLTPPCGSRTTPRRRGSSWREMRSPCRSSNPSRSSARACRRSPRS